MPSHNLKNKVANSFSAFIGTIIDNTYIYNFLQRMKLRYIFYKYDVMKTIKLFFYVA